MKLIVISIGLGLGAMLLAACQSATPARAPSRTVASTPVVAVSSATAAPTPTQSTPAVQNAICALVFHAEVSGGHCRATNVKVSTADSAWVYARVGIYSSQGQLMSDSDLVILNLTTHKVIGPTNVGFCGAGPTGSNPIGGYESVPADVLAGLGLRPCQGATGGATSVAAFAGTWRAHEMVLGITPAGAGHLIYPDLTACPSCSEGTAPAGTLDFTLTSVANGAGAGHVTASSDVKNWAVGLPVQVKLSAGSPGQLLNVQIDGKQLLAFCNNSSAGQCGA